MALELAIRRLLARLPGRLARYGHAALRRATLRRFARAPAPRILLVTHDLSRSGAPLLVVEMARMLRAAGYAPLVLSPVDGPFALDLRQDGIELVIDPRLGAGPGWLGPLARGSVGAICNTVETAPVVLALAPDVGVLWYLHEVSLLQDRIDDDNIRGALRAARTVWAGSPMCADIVRTQRADVAVVPYGVTRIEGARPVAASGPFTIGVFGSIEPRKGQDFVVDAAARLPADARLRLYGRVLAADFAAEVLDRAKQAPNVDYRGEVDLEGYRAALRDIDAVLVSSRDDTLPLVSIDALGAERMLLLLPSVGTSAWLTDGVDALIAREISADGIVDLVNRAIDTRASAAQMGSAAATTFDRAFSLDAFREKLLSAVRALAA